MTFYQRYLQEQTWYGRILIMEIFHLVMVERDNTWTVLKTSYEFGVSVGLASENLQLAAMSHREPTILNCETREQALKRLRNETRILLSDSN